MAGTVESRVPPGAYVAKFYYEGDLEVGTSGLDSHPLGATLLRISCHVDIPSSAGDIVVGVWKEEVKFAEIHILPGERNAGLDLVGLDLVQTFPSFLTEAPSMYFRREIDHLKVEIIEVGLDAAKLTVRCIFDR